ncbi:MAG: hypothetical protein KF796_19600 [Ramlibacter sp.]|nr:hypothetical protein [Ramlibacter sp.]
MSLRTRIAGWLRGADPVADTADLPPTPSAQQTTARVTEAAGAQSGDEPGYRRLSGEGVSKYNDRDLAPVAQDRMAKLAEFLWQSNLLANRLVELPLAYLLAEGVTLQCEDPEHQKLLDKFWNDPINNWPLKLPGRVRGLSLLGEQCYILNVNSASGFTRLGYLDPRQIATVVMDPGNPEQPIGVVTKKDTRGRSYKYQVALPGKDEELFSAATIKIREEDFKDGECLLYQINKLPNGSRGRSDLLAQMDWLDAYDEFLFNELDRISYLRSFVWDVTMKGSDPKAVEEYEKKFKAPAANSKFVHNDQIELKAITPELQAADTSESARLLRNHVLGGATVPEHWFGGGGDVNRAAASEMDGPTMKIYTARQSMLKLMLEEIGRIVIIKGARLESEADDERCKVTAVFPELANKDLTKFASAMSTVATTVVMMIDNDLLTQERGLQLVADVAARFGQQIDAKAELAKAKEEATQRKKERAKDDAFALTADERAAMAAGQRDPKAKRDAAAASV